MLLEGIRVATGNNQYTFPPRDLILDQAVLDASQPLGRAEYMLFVAGQGPLTSTGPNGIEIADPNLSFFWSRNNASIIRFDYDMFGRRWNTLPGGPPLNIGMFGNSPRIAAPVPDQTVTALEAPYYIFIGLPRQTTFTVQIVESDSDFGTPPVGTVQLSLQTGDLNWGPADLANASYQNQPVYVSQQSFNSRNQSKGIFGQLPQSASESYLLYLNPIPGVGQIPRIRIGYQPYLTTVSYATEALLTTPVAGTVAWSQDTGRILFAPADISANLQSNVYYDGVLLGQLSFVRTFVAIIQGLLTFYPTSIGSNALLNDMNLDSLRYVFFAEPPVGPRYYFNVVLGNSSQGGLSGPGQGQVLVDVATGNIYISQSDAQLLNTAPLYFLDSALPVERGVAAQFYRSGVNGGGAEQTPDFTEKYLVTEQVIQSTIMGSPFAQLPTVPLVDSNLAFNVLPNTSGGTFVGPLFNNADPTEEATGYILNLDQKQIQYSSRKFVMQTLLTAQPSIKLTDAAIFTQGFEVTETIGLGPTETLTPGVQFSFNASSGIIDFLTPVGEDDPSNILNIAGTAVLPNTFISGTPVFVSANSGMFLLVSQGPNVNLYQITGVLNSTTIQVSPNFVAPGSLQADVRAEREIVADRFFTNFTPPLRTFTLSHATSVNGLYTALPQSAFSVFILTGQVNLTTPTQPGDVFKISYIWQQSPDNGVTVTPTPVTELAAFKIRQETATVVPNTSTILFNPAGRTVQTSKGITLYIDGVTQDPTSYNFVAPGTLTYNQNLTAANVVILDYYVAESPGGNSNFFLTNSPISIDYPQILSGATSATFNGNQTSLLQTGSVFLLNTTDLINIGTVTYDATADTTTVQFSGPSAYTNAPTGATPTPIQVCAPISGALALTYMVTETNSVDLLPSGTNVISINAQVNYPQNTVVLVDGDPYLVLSSTYDSTANVTSVTLADRATRNYIISSLQHSIRPVLQAGTDFQTALSATLAFPFTLVDSGTTPRLLTQGVDYTVSDGGNVKLTASIGYGDVLNALYVGRNPQPAGTTFTFNYAYAIAPSTANGLLNQQLAMTYDLYAPDTFFFNIETIASYIPIVIATISQNTSAGVGPNIQSQMSPQTKDQGTPSLYWPEVHYGNEDIVVQRLLYFYNTLINNYEDILSDLDGRVVGGVNGKFRYDGNSQVVTTYAQITNDIDDAVVLYNNTQLTSFFVFQDVPVYGYMYDPNNLSRIYPTADPFVTTPLKSVPSGPTGILDYGNTIGTTGIPNLTSVSTLISSRASSAVITATGTGTTNPPPPLPPTTATVAIITTNGDSTNLIPPFSSGQTVQFYNGNGSPNGGTGTVSSVVSNPDGTFTLGVSGVAITMLGGGVVQVIGSGGHYYTPGRDFNINNQDGIFTSNYLDLPSPPFPSVVHISGNELVDTTVTFVNSDTTPRRIPVLDGLTLSDNGRPAVPALSRNGELTYLGIEQSSLTAIGHGTVVGSVITAVIGYPFTVPTIGQSGTTATVTGISGTSATISAFDGTSLITLTGLTNMNASLVGGSMVVTNTAHTGNTGTFIIAAYISPTSVQVTNVTGAFPDANSGSIHWQLTGSGTGATFGSFASPVLTLTGLTNMSGGLVGSSITITGASNSGNNGTFTISAFVSATSIQINNANGSTGGTFNWAIEPGGVILQGLVGAIGPTLVGVAIKVSGSSHPGNNGTFVIASIVSGSAVVIVNPNAFEPDAGPLNWSIAGTSTIVFLNGPNSGISATATSVTPTTITVSSPYPINDPSGSDYYIVEPTGDLVQAINGELYVLEQTMSAPIAPPALISSVDSELTAIDTAIRSYGQFQATGSTAMATSTTVLTDPTANFSTAEPPIISSSLLYVTSGPNQGLYAIASLTNTTITINPGAPYPMAFPSLSANSPYIVMQPWSFLSTQEFAFASSFQQSTLAFYASTFAWANDVTALGVGDRALAVIARLAAIGTASAAQGFIPTVQGLLGQTDNLYNIRYLWIQQRTDKTIGLLIQQVQAEVQRITNTANLVSAQQKLFIMNQLLKALL
jgi:hypothetical protein